MSDTALVKREEFGAEQMATTAEKSVAGIAAREQAIIQAEYVMAERHPRVWLDVRGRMMDHCKRPRFAEITRYCKPVGKALINGEWTETKARGFTIRFAETLAQEMGNVKPWTSTSYEDDRIRIVRIGVTDLQRNVPWSQEITVAKVVEKRGRKKGGDEWLPPEGREVISSRVNSRGDMTFLVAATDDEILAKQNSAISKVQRNFLLKLCPRDILEDCEEKVAETLAKEDKSDPKAGVKKWIDRFGALGVIPSDLVNYLGKPVEQWREADVSVLRELGTAIKDGETTFQQALKIRYSTAETQETDIVPTQLGTAERIIADLKLQEGPLGAELAKGFTGLESTIGSAAFSRMLGSNGYSALSEIPDFKAGRKVFKAMVAEAQAAGFTVGVVDA